MWLYLNSLQMTSQSISRKRAKSSLRRKYAALLEEQCPSHSVRRYGDGKSNNNCLRVQDSNRRKKSKNHVRPYALAFTAYHGYCIDGGNISCHSHQCGTPRSVHSICINGRHILEQSQKDNNKRQRHHNLIRKYEGEFRRKYPNKRRVGPLYVDDVLEFVDIASKEYIVCDCGGGRCFINYGEREPSRRSSRVRV